MPKLPVLSFDISSAPFEDENGYDGAGPVLGIDVKPVLDGVPFPALGVFDAVDMLLYGATDAETDLYTCSCGVAGCAGFHESVQLRVGAETMEWLFPEQPYRAALNSERFPAGLPLRVVFDKAQYVQALADLQAAITALFDTSAIPAMVIPGWSLGATGAASFLEMLEDARVRRLKWDAECRARAQAEGQTREFRYVAYLPNGWILFHDMCALAWELAAEHQLSDQDSLALVRETIAPRLLAEQVQAILKLSAQERARVFAAENLGLPDEAWLSARFDVVTYAEAKAISLANRQKKA